MLHTIAFSEFHRNPIPYSYYQINTSSLLVFFCKDITSETGLITYWFISSVVSGEVQAGSNSIFTFLSHSQLMTLLRIYHPATIFIFPLVTVVTKSFLPKKASASTGTPKLCQLRQRKKFNIANQLNTCGRTRKAKRERLGQYYRSSFSTVKEHRTKPGVVRTSEKSPVELEPGSLRMGHFSALSATCISSLGRFRKTVCEGINRKLNTGTS